MFLYSATTKGFYTPDFKTLPKDVVEVSDTAYKELFVGQSAGKVISPDAKGYPALVEPQNYENSSSVELAWVAQELDRIRDELEKVQDSDTKAIGTVAQWRDYRKVVRSWVDQEQFPNKEFRPKAPDVA